MPNLELPKATHWSYLTKWGLKKWATKLPITSKSSITVFSLISK